MGTNTREDPESLVLEKLSVMNLAIRLLTLAAFTAHAALGCCLSHGSCMHERLAVLDQPVCDHAEHGEHAAHGDQAESGGYAAHGAACQRSPERSPRGHVPTAHDIMAAHQITAACIDAEDTESYNPQGPDHSHHGDEDSCVFVVTSPAVVSSAWQLGVGSSWVNVSGEAIGDASRQPNYFSDQLPGPSRVLQLRAQLQRWLI